MNIRTQRALDRHLGVPLCALLSLLERLRPRRSPANPPGRILIILLSEMGSLVLAQPMFERLKRAHPEAELHVLLLRKNREILDLLDLVPAERIHTLDDASLVRFARDAFGVLARLRRLGIDAVIDCELFARAGALLAYLSGARLRVGFHPHTQEGLYRGSFINRPVPYNPHRHISRQFLTLAWALNSTTIPAGKDEGCSADECGNDKGKREDGGKAGLQEMPVIRPLPFDAQEARAALDRLKRDFPAMGDRPLVLVHPSGGALPIRAWPMEHFAALCRGLVEAGLAVGIIGLDSDHAAGELLASRCGDPRCFNLMGYTRSIHHLLNLFRGASLLIANDGGPGQFAPLTGLPSIVLFGPETPALYGPLGAASHAMSLDLPCAPCLTAYNHRCSPCDGDNQCLQRISPDRVLDRALELLDRPRGGGSAVPQA